MCGSISYEGTDKKIGNITTLSNYVVKDMLCVPILLPNGQTEVVQLLGHSRSERGDPPNSVRVKIAASSYTEKGVEYSVPENKCIGAVLVTSKSFPEGKGIFIVTREATPAEKQKCSHPRHPVFW